MAAGTRRTEDAQGPLSEYQALVYNIFQLPRSTPHGLAIALTSPTRGAGTTHLTKALTNELGAHPTHRILRVDLQYLARHVRSAAEVLEMVRGSSAATIFELSGELSGELSERAEAATERNGAGGDSVSTGGIAGAFWHASVEHRRECIDLLREQFQYILFDCPALRRSGDTLGIASLVDGLLLVVEADRTTKAEMLQAERQIESTGGRLFGSILNKRKYLVPDWARRRL